MEEIIYLRSFLSLLIGVRINDVLYGVFPSEAVSNNDVDNVIVIDLLRNTTRIIVSFGTQADGQTPLLTELDSIPSHYNMADLPTRSKAWSAERLSGLSVGDYEFFRSDNSSPHLERMKNNTIVGYNIVCYLPASPTAIVVILDSGISFVSMPSSVGNIISFDNRDMQWASATYTISGQSCI